MGHYQKSRFSAVSNPPILLLLKSDTGTAKGKDHRPKKMGMAVVQR
jgi:hypothetical protein